MKKLRSGLLTIVSFVMLFSCSQEVQEKELTSPGFGVTATTIDVAPEGVNIPVLLKSDETIKGLQFTLSWDPTIGQVIKPVIKEVNSSFTVSASEGERGAMKVLIFSMTGDVLDTSDPVIMEIPVRIINEAAEQFDLHFYDTIFAGPKAVSYEIPVTHANLKIIR